jgi:dipeptidyl aminopeptidase/acylaminoacyl peptidase
MRKLLAVCWLLTLPQLAVATGKPISHEDLWLMPRLSAPALSPDGRLAAVVVTHPAYARKEQQADLWLLQVDGGQPPRQLTFDAAAEAGPSFSGDGRQLLFAAQRAGDSSPQIYLLDLERGGEARPLAKVESGAKLPQFSPDGRQVLFISAVFREANNQAEHAAIAKARKDRRDHVRVYTGFPIRNWDRWLDDRQQRPLVLDLQSGEIRDLLAGSALAAGPGFGGRFSFTGEELDAVWAPDGQSVVFAATENRHKSAFQIGHSDLYQVGLDGTVRRLTGTADGGSAASWSYPKFSADGRHLLALVAPRGDVAYSANRLGALRWPSLEPLPQVELPEALSVNSFGLGGDGRTLWMTAEHQGLEKLYSGRLGEPTARLSMAPKAGVYTGLQVAGRTLIANHDSATSPAEVVRLEPSRSGHVALSGFSRERAAALDLAPLEHFWFEGADGQRVHNMLVKPAGFDPSKRYPLFVLIHGGPHTMWRDTFVLRWNYHLIAGSEFVVLLSNYSGSTGFGEDFARRIHGDPLKGPADEINQAADIAIERHAFIDAQRQCAGGASYGGHLANWLQGTTTRYLCLVSHAGLVNLESQWGSSDVIYHRELGAGGPVWERNPIWVEQNPMLRAANFRTPVLVTVGERDYRVPLNNTLEYWSLLQRQQVESRLLVFADENHWILKGENSRTFYRELDGWLRRFLLTSKAPAP